MLMKIVMLKLFKVKYSLAFVIILFFPSCSTQTDSVANRTYHQLNTKYNGLFYAEQYLKEGVKKIQQLHTDDYKQILRINEYGDLKVAQSAQTSFDKAIEKSTAAIQQHSMDINGEEKNKLIDKNYIIIGQSYFYKKEYAAALNTFNYVIRKSNKEELKSDAVIWSTRCHQELNNREALRKNIITLEEDFRLNRAQYALLDEIQAEASIKEGYYAEAAQHLERVIEKSKDKYKKTRIHYILGQLYLSLKEPEKALKEFNEVIKRNPKYEMVFNAKLTRTQTYVSDKKNFKELNESLQKMLKDAKNIEYKDQIYFALANLELKNVDTTGAIKSLQLSTKNSTLNTAQKLESHYLLANLFWDKKNYVKAYNHCDSTYQLTDSKSPKYDEIKKMLRSSKKIANKYNIINYNDSIIGLARLPEEERNQIIDEHITSLKKAELEKKS